MDSDKFQEPVYLSNGSQIRIQEGRNNPIDIFDNAYTSFSAVYRRKSVNLMMYYQGSVRLIKRDTTNGRTSMQTIVPRIEDDPRNIPWAGLMRTDDVRVSFCVSYFASESIALKVFWKTDIIENQPGILCSEIDDNDAFQNIKALPIPGTLPADMTYGGSTSLLMENFSSLNKDKISLREFDYSNNSKSITQLIIETDENTRGTSLVQAGRCIYIGGEHGYIQVSSGSVVRPGDAIIIKSCNGDQKVLTWGTERRDYVTSLAQGDDENLYVALIMGGPLTHDPPQDRKQLALIKRISPFSFAN